MLVAGKWGGRRAQALTRRVVYRDSGICWLCGQPGATTADHVMPQSRFPELTWVESNLRAAHRRCNQSRGASGWHGYTEQYGIPGNHPALSAATATWTAEPVDDWEPAPTPRRPTWAIV